MIKLNVDKYCHDCPHFKPETISYNTLNGVTNHMVAVRCEHYLKCRAIRKYLVSEMKVSEDG